MEEEKQQMKEGLRAALEEMSKLNLLLQVQNIVIDPYRMLSETRDTTCMFQTAPCAEEASLLRRSLKFLVGMFMSHSSV